MRVAIAGAGNVGLFIANDLRAAEHDVLMIEQNPVVVKRAQSDNDGPAGRGDGDRKRPEPQHPVLDVRRDEIHRRAPDERRNERVRRRAIEPRGQRTTDVEPC